MAKWGFGEASGARHSIDGIGIIRILGVRTIMGDGLRGFPGPPERSGIAYLRHDRTLVSRVLQLMSGNPIILMGQKGWQICVGMGPYRRRSALVQLETSGACHAGKVRLVQWRLGEQKSRLSRIEATYRHANAPTRLPGSRSSRWRWMP